MKKKGVGRLKSDKTGSTLLPYGVDKGKEPPIENKPEEDAFSPSRPGSTPPSIYKDAFDCPFCGAFTSQEWFVVGAKNCSDPTLFRRQIEAIKKNPLYKKKSKNLGERMFSFYSDRIAIFQENSLNSFEVDNLLLSKCFHCKEYAVWVHDRLVFPSQKIGVAPNEDLSEDIKRDFEEAREVLNASPRSAAAMLRLCIQKLCEMLGKKDMNLNQAIMELVAEGLNPAIQKSLDIVRVIGNNAVHPGVMNIKDNREIALRLLSLVNIIAEQTLTLPRKISELYESLPESDLQNIAKRDKHKC